MVEDNIRSNLDKRNDEENDCGEDDVFEDSITTAVAGYVLPLGMTPDQVGRKRKNIS